MPLHGSVTIFGALLFLLAGCQQGVLATIDTPPEALEYNGTLYAACKLRPSTSLTYGLPRIYGQLMFRQVSPHTKLKILLWFNGFPSDGDSQPRAVHIHQFGDLSEGCDSTGGHYNPYDVHHPNHPGDFGNFEPRNRRIFATLESEATLFGALTVIGRAVVIHEKADDLGRGGNTASLLNGNAGRRLGCCVIGLCTPKLWNKHRKRFSRLRDV